MTVEPEHFVPILPMVLVNGSSGIGTGWSTSIPNHDIRQVVKNVKRMINDQEPQELIPKYKDYRGQIVELEKSRQSWKNSTPILGLKINFMSKIVVLVKIGNSKIVIANKSGFFWQNCDQL